MYLSEQEERAILTVCLLAAFADGAKDDREREQIRRLAESLGFADLPALYQDVLLKRVPVEEAVTPLRSQEAKQFAYEMAVGVCDSDGARNEAERAFLDKLRAALGLDAAPAQSFATQADEIATAPLNAAPAVPSELEQTVLNYSILNGALELLPQTLASLAILPLQMKMVYGIGKSYGYELDREHIKDFAATLGVGFTGQYVEQMGRKLVGGLFGKLAGGLLGGIGGAATGAAFSFATTYALGHVAIRYYSGGRTINVDQLRDVFASLFERGKSLQNVHSSDIVARARNIDLSQINRLVQGISPR